MLRRNGSDFARVPFFLAAILPFNDIFYDPVTSTMTTRAPALGARSGESLGIKAVALAVLVDR